MSRSLLLKTQERTAQAGRIIQSLTSEISLLRNLSDMISFLIPNYVKEGKNQLVISIGCTGGKHRSVTLANELYKRLSTECDYGLKIEHRDIGKDAARGK